MQCARCYFDNPAGTRHCAYCGGELGQHLESVAVNGAGQKRKTQLGPPPGPEAWKDIAPPAIELDDPFQIAATGIRGGAAAQTIPPQPSKVEQQPEVEEPPGRAPSPHRPTLVEEATPDISAEIVGCVIVLPQEGPASTVLMREGATRIGRSRSCQIILDDPRVSGEHAIVQVEQGEAWVLDTSSNGTIVSGERVRMDRAPLADGAVMRFGRTLVVVKLLSEGTLTLLRGIER